MPITIVVHGGAGDFAPELFAEAQEGCHLATLAGWRILQEGGSALDAVEAAVRILEDTPVFNSGTGAALTAEGNIELDAGIMDGRSLNLGAVASIELIKNPISLARQVLHSPHVMLIGDGAEQFAAEHGITRCSFEDLLTERQYLRWQDAQQQTATSSIPEAVLEGEPTLLRREIGSVTARSEELPSYDGDDGEPKLLRREVGIVHAHEPASEEKHGTVGAVAIDSTGALAAATSTGGLYHKYPGRVGDSPLVGCGFYADDQAAISCTGQGEDFVRLMIARRAAEYVEQGRNAQEAAKAAIAFLDSHATGTGGLIVVDHHGDLGFAWNTQQMARGYITSGMDAPVTAME
jgi:beta-aspartyl-peptidase (threonine type)